MAALDGFDRLKRALVAIIDHRMNRVDYLALYPARVASQNSDGTLELVPDGTRFKGMSRVPLRLGLPGVTVEVEKDSRVLVGFEAGDKARPYASVWDTSTVTSITLKAETKVVVDAPSVEIGGEGGRPISGVGDFARLGGALPIVGEAMFSLPGETGPVTKNQPVPVFLTFRKPVMLPIVSGSKRGKVKS
jgi:hypothetical protein